jgi:hypothetical protein
MLLIIILFFIHSLFSFLKICQIKLAKIVIVKVHVKVIFFGSWNFICFLNFN